MRNLQTLSDNQHNNLAAFEQQVYQSVFQRRRDALSDLLYGLLTTSKPNSLVALSQSPVHQRQWMNPSKALADGHVDAQAFETIASALLPAKDRLLFALDVSTWPHPYTRTLPGLMNTKKNRWDRAVKTHRYSQLVWLPEDTPQWALPLSTERVVVSEGGTGADQLDRLLASLPIAPEIWAVADGRYSSTPCLQSMQSLPITLIVRIANNRVLYSRPLPNKRGRPRVHGERFGCQDPTTWGIPDETIVFTHPRYGQVHLERWNQRHPKRDATIEMDLIRASIDQACDRPSPPIWLGALHASHASLRDLWEAYTQRWNIEVGFRFRKQSLGWTKPQLQSADACDRWTTLVDIATWWLYLARDLIPDHPLPWQKSQPTPTPQRLHQSAIRFLATRPLPTCPPKPRGKSPGWPPGKPRRAPPRYPARKPTANSP